MCKFMRKNKCNLSIISFITKSQQGSESLTHSFKGFESKVFILIIMCIFVSASCALLPTTVYASEADAMYVWSDSVETSTIPNATNVTNASNTNQANLANSDNQANSLELTCGGAVLIEQETGKVLYEHNAHEKLRPASVTKVMSLLLIMEALDEGRITLKDKVPCSANAAAMGGSQIWLDVTEELSVNDMLKAICVVSAND